MDDGEASWGHCATWLVENKSKTQRLVTTTYFGHGKQWFTFTQFIKWCIYQWFGSVCKWCVTDNRQLLFIFYHFIPYNEQSCSS